MKEIHWKSLSFSLIISTIVNGFILLILIIQFMNTTSILFHEILSEMDNSNASGKTAYTFAEGNPLYFWIWIPIFVLSYLGVTLISYFLIELLNRRKKIHL
jgi:amino acid permease